MYQVLCECEMGIEEDCLHSWIKKSLAILAYFSVSISMYDVQEHVVLVILRSSQKKEV